MAKVLREKRGQIDSNGRHDPDRKVCPAGQAYQGLVHDWSQVFANTGIRF